MDSLALLCNLYGDGPQTLRRLREAGCGTLAALESIESERLASLLRTSVRAAKRFQVEGRLLRERSDPAVERPGRKRPTEVLPTQEAATPDPLLAPVLVAWRARDAEVGSQARAWGDSPAVSMSSLSEGGSSGEGVPLEVLEGMDGTLIASLRAAGVVSLRDLCGADVLDLAGRGVAGYTRLLRVQFLARRRMAGDSEGRARTVGVTGAPTGLLRSEVVVASGQHSCAVRGRASDACAGNDGQHARGESAPREEASTTLLEPVVVIPHPPPERRRTDRAPTPARSDLDARFSPSLEPGTPVEPPLQSELQRYALDRDPAIEDSAATAAREVEGSSGPFA